MKVFMANEIFTTKVFIVNETFTTNVFIANEAFITNEIIINKKLLATKFIIITIDIISDENFCIYISRITNLKLTCRFHLQ